MDSQHSKVVRLNFHRHQHAEVHWVCTPLKCVLLSHWVSVGDEDGREGKEEVIPWETKPAISHWCSLLRLATLNHCERAVLTDSYWWKPAVCHMARVLQSYSCRTGLIAFVFVVAPQLWYFCFTSCRIFFPVQVELWDGGGFFFLSVGHKKKKHKKTTCNVKRCKVFTNRTDGGTDTCNPSRVIHCKRDSVFSSFSFFLLDASFPRGIPVVGSVSSRSPAYKQHESSWLLPVPLGQRLLITGAASSPQISACLL